MRTSAAHQAELHLIKQVTYQTCAMSRGHPTKRRKSCEVSHKYMFRTVRFRFSLAGEKWKGACLRNGYAVRRRVGNERLDPFC